MQASFRHTSEATVSGRELVTHSDLDYVAYLSTGRTVTASREPGHACADRRYPCAKIESHRAGNMRKLLLPTITVEGR